MRKAILMILFLFGLLIPMNIRAEVGYANDPSDENDIHEIRAHENELLAEINGMLVSDEDVEKMKLDLDSAIKVYVDVDLFAPEALTEAEIKSAVADKEHIWLIPIRMEGVTYWATVARGKEVSPEAREILDQSEIEMLESQVGMWNVTEVKMGDGGYSYTDSLMQTLNSQGVLDGRIYMFGGTVGYRWLLAVVCNEEDIYFVPVDPIMEPSFNTGSAEDEQSDKITYSFSEMKEIAEENVLEEGEVGGGLDNSEKEKTFPYAGIVVVSIMMIMMAGGVTVSFIKRRRHFEN